jgi:hypothetical protein
MHKRTAQHCIELNRVKSEIRKIGSSLLKAKKKKILQHTPPPFVLKNTAVRTRFLVQKWTRFVDLTTIISEQREYKHVFYTELMFSYKLSSH